MMLNQNQGWYWEVEHKNLSLDPKLKARSLDYWA